jgi:hypothetical protein
MMRRARLNIALGLVLAGLAAGVYFSRETEEKKPPLTTLVADNITSAKLEHPDSPAIKLEKKGTTWWITEPVEAEADPLEINSILGVSSFEQRKTLEPSAVKLADLGLDPPQFSVTLNETKLLFGGLEPIQFQRYIKVGDAIVLTDDPPNSALDKDYSDLVNKAIVPQGEIQKIEVPGLTLEKSPDGKWFVSPPDPSATTDQMQKLADGWKNARSLWNELDVNAKDAKGDPVTITLKDRTLEFVIVNREPQLQLVRPDVGVRFNLSKALTDELLKLPPPPAEGKAAETPAATDEKK